jgi:S-adenosylmethionine synthetase
VEYKNGGPKRIEAVVIAAQHSPDVRSKVLREAIMDEVVRKVLPKDMLDADTKVFINATGRLWVGAPWGTAAHRPQDHC